MAPRTSIHCSVLVLEQARHIFSVLRKDLIRQPPLANVDMMCPPCRILSDPCLCDETGGVGRSHHPCVVSTQYLNNCVDVPDIGMRWKRKPLITSQVEYVQVFGTALSCYGDDATWMPLRLRSKGKREWPLRTSDLSGCVLPPRSSPDIG